MLYLWSQPAEMLRFNYHTAENSGFMGSIASGHAGTENTEEAFSPAVSRDGNSSIPWECLRAVPEHRVLSAHMKENTSFANIPVTAEQAPTGLERRNWTSGKA